MRLSRRSIVPLALGAIVLVLLAELVVARALRPMVEEQLSELAGAPVSIGGLELSLVGASVAATQVQVGSADAAAPGPGLDRFELWLSRRALLGGTLGISEVALTGPRLTLERDRDGTWHVAGLPPSGAGESPPPEAPRDADDAAAEASGDTAPEPEEAPPAALDVGRVRVREGRLRLQARGADPATPMEIVLTDASVDGLRLRGPAADDPSRLQIQAKLGDGTLTTDGRIRIAGAESSVDLALEARALPLRGVRVFLPDVGWRTLTGDLDAALRLVADTETQTARGTIRLRDVVTTVPGVEKPVLSWRALTVRVDALDLTARRLAVTRIDLDGATVLVRTGEGAPLPVLEALASAPAEDDPAPPFAWSVDDVRVKDATIVLQTPEQALVIGLDAAIDAGEASGDARGHLRAALREETTDTALRLRGTLDLDPFAFAGRTVLAIGAELPVRALASRRPEWRAVEGGRLHADLDVEIGADPVLALGGLIRLREVQIGTPDGEHSAVGIEQLDLDITRIELAKTSAPVDVALGRVVVQRPRVRIVRDADGIRLYDASAAGAAPGADASSAAAPDATAAPEAAPSPAAAASPEPVGAPTTAAPPEPTPTAEPPADGPPAAGALQPTDGTPAPGGGAPADAPATTDAPAPPPHIAIDELVLADGVLEVEDRSVRPFLRITITDLESSAASIAWPENRFTDLVVRGSGPSDARLTLTGGLETGDGAIELELEDLTVGLLNTYVTRLLGHSIRGGELSLDSKIRVRGRLVDVDNWLVLDDLDLKRLDDDVALERQIGVSLPLALALLRDPRGKIGLKIPVEVDLDDPTEARLGTTLRSAVRQALIGALSSPLKLLGAVVPKRGKVVSRIGLAPIPFAPGAATVARASEGRARLEQMSRFMAERPALRLVLHGRAGGPDVTGLRERRLLRALDSGDDLPEAARGLFQLGERSRAEEILAARVAGKEPPTPEPDDAFLDDWLAAVPVGAADLEALAAARAAKVQTTLAERFGVDAERVAIGALRLGDDAPPAVDVELAR